MRDPVAQPGEKCIDATPPTAELIRLSGAPLIELKIVDGSIVDVTSHQHAVLLYAIRVALAIPEDNDRG